MSKEKEYEIYFKYTNRDVLTVTAKNKAEAREKFDDEFFDEEDTEYEILEIESK